MEESALEMRIDEISRFFMSSHTLKHWIGSINLAILTILLVLKLLMIGIVLVVQEFLIVELNC